MTSNKRFKAFFVTELCSRMTYKVENRKMVFIFMQTESAPKLLQKDSSTLCWSQKENSIYFWNVHTFVKKVNNKQIVDGTCL